MSSNPHDPHFGCWSNHVEAFVTNPIEASDPQRIQRSNVEADVLQSQPFGYVLMDNSPHTILEQSEQVVCLIRGYRSDAAQE